MDTEAIVANEWASLLSCANRLERNLKLSQKLIDEKSLSALEEAVSEYLNKYRNFLEKKEKSQ